MSSGRRFIAAALVAGLAVNIADGLLYTVVIGPDAAAGMERLGLDAPGTAGMLLYTGLGFLVGFVAFWLYTGMRARLGAGPATALKTGLAVWAVAYLAPFLDQTIEGIFTARMFWIGALYTLVSMPLVALLAARVYERPAQPEVAPEVAVE